MAGSVLLRSLRNRSLPSKPLYYTKRCITTKPPQNTQPKSLNHMSPNKSWLTHKVEESPIWRTLFFGLTNIMGYGSPKQMAGRQAFILYDKICATKPDEDRVFWQDSKLDTSFSSLWYVLSRTLMVIVTCDSIISLTN